MATRIARKSKQDWLHAGLVALEAEGVRAVRVERLARELGVAKSGFYWHFQDRDDLLRAMLAYWSDKYTGVVMVDPTVLAAPPLVRLQRIMEIVVDADLTRFDLAIRAWAEHDPRASRAYKRAYRTRLDFVGAAFAELGFTGDELEMRTRLFVGYQSWERAAFRDTKKGRRRLIGRRLRLLTRN